MIDGMAMTSSTGVYGKTTDGTHKWYARPDRKSKSDGVATERKALPTAWKRCEAWYGKSTSDGVYGYDT